MPTNKNWNFKTNSWEKINIFYKGAPSFWSKDTFKINNIEIIDLKKCIKREEKLNEDDFFWPVCKETYNWFSFNWKKIDYDFKNSMDAIYISKNESKIALYWWKLIIDFEKNNYTINDNSLILKKEEYILFKKVY